MDLCVLGLLSTVVLSPAVPPMYDVCHGAFPSLWAAMVQSFFTIYFYISASIIGYFMRTECGGKGRVLVMAVFLSTCFGLFLFY